MVMENDFLKELEYVGLIARFKRLSDSMLQSVRDLYEIKGLDIEPNWHLVFLLLKKHEKRTMTEIAEAFQMSLPAVHKIINKMKKKGYVEITEDENDSRKRQIQLSQKAKNKLPMFEKIWGAGRESLIEIIKGTAMQKNLEEVEQRLEQTNFKDRVLNNLNE